MQTADRCLTRRPTHRSNSPFRIDCTHGNPCVGRTVDLWELAAYNAGGSPLRPPIRPTLSVRRGPTDPRPGHHSGLPYYRWARPPSPGLRTAALLFY